MHACHNHDTPHASSDPPQIQEAVWQRDPSFLDGRRQWFTEQVFEYGLIIQATKSGCVATGHAARRT
eukprot:1362352-Pyramimonas_sp.AAC.1